MTLLLPTPLQNAGDRITFTIEFTSASLQPNSRLSHKQYTIVLNGVKINTDATDYTALVYPGTSSSGKELARMHLGASEIGRMEVFAGDFLKLGRSQFFITLRLGVHVHYLLDWDGVRLRQLYEDHFARAEVMLDANLDGTYDLVERWRSEWVTQGKDVGFAPWQGGYVQRRLRWNGERFAVVTGESH